jgi:hypothetical protein
VDEEPEDEAVEAEEESNAESEASEHLEKPKKRAGPKFYKLKVRFAHVGWISCNGINRKSRPKRCIQSLGIRG